MKTTEEQLDAAARRLKVRLEYLLLAIDSIYPKPPERQAIIRQHMKQKHQDLHHSSHTSEGQLENER